MQLNVRVNFCFGVFVVAVVASFVFAVAVVVCFVFVGYFVCFVANMKKTTKLRRVFLELEVLTRQTKGNK